MFPHDHPLLDKDSELMKEGSKEKVMEAFLEEII